MMTFLMALAGAATLVSSPAATEAAWDGTQSVHLGDTVSAEFVGAPLAEVHKYSFYALKDTVMNTKITVDSSAAGLVPELRLYTSDEVPVDLGATQVGNQVKNFKFTASGPYYLRVRATAGTGVYKLTTKSKYPTKLSGTTTTGAFAFDVVVDSVVNGNVKKSKGSTATPTIATLTYNGGAVDVGTSAGTSKLAKTTLPVNGTYTLAINPGTAGQGVNVNLTLTAPRAKTWSFGFIEDTDGLANQNRTKWMGSGHGDHTALPFNDWNDANPPVVPTSCARCHTTSGYRDYLGADGTAVGVVNNAVPVGEVVDCDACHNDATAALTSVTFPSALTISGLGKEARCMVCHQGRESSVSVEASINKAEVLTTINNNETAGTGIVGSLSTVIANNETAGTGVVGANLPIAASATFTDVGADFVAAGITVDGTYYLKLVSNAAYLSGADGAVTTKNLSAVQITGVTADTLTLKTALVAESPALSTSFQYTVVRVSGNSIAAAATFTDAGADFGTAGVTNDGTYYLQFLWVATDLNGRYGVVSTKNAARFPITGVSGDTLTLARSLAAETPATGTTYQYRVVKVTSDDTPMALPPSSGQTYGTLGFKNVHYFAAAASLYGREVAGAYEYPDPSNVAATTIGGTPDAILTSFTKRDGYDRKFTHVAQKDTCIECHDPHSLQVRVADCADCHVNRLGNPVANYDDLRDIRMAATINDYDADGDVTEGIYYEIKGMQDKLYAAMQDYATRVTGTSIEYKGDTYPYFFKLGTSSSFDKWTGRLLRAAYNYQYSIKDPGSFAHNGKYIIEILYDSIGDLNSTLSSPAYNSPVPGFDKMWRNDPNHFDSDDEPYRDWESSGAISASCTRCHSVDNFKFVVKYGVEPTTTAPLISGMSCESCHVVGTNFGPESINPNKDKKPEREYVASVWFPYPSTGTTSTQISNVTITNGAKGTAAQDDSFICMTCHRARESMLTVEAGDVGGLTTAFTLSAKNPHYFPAGAMLYGNKAAVAYQYAGKTYAQRYDHEQNYLTPYPATASTKAQCTFCHMQEGSHSFDADPSTATCTYCHVGTTSVDDLKPAFRAEDNYDNNTATKPKAEAAVFAARLYAAIQKWAADAKTAGKSGAEWTIFYNADNPSSTASKGFYKDGNHNGVLDLSELTSANANKWDSKGYRAAFNYRLYVNEPGAWAHNPRYTLQILYDSTVDLGGDVTGLTRP